MRDKLLDLFGRPIKNFTIPRKLGSGFGTLSIVLALLIGGISMVSLNLLNREVQQTLSVQNALAARASELLNQYSEARQYERDFALQARTGGGLNQAEQVYSQWRASTMAMGRTLEDLRRTVATQANREGGTVQADEFQDLEVMEASYRRYMENANEWFEVYRERGDQNSGAMAEWLGSVEVLDQRLDRFPVSDQAFNDDMIALRSNQFNFLVTEEKTIGHDIQDLYDDLQAYLLFTPGTSTTNERTITQTLVGEESASFAKVNRATRDLVALGFIVESTSDHLQLRVQSFADEANSSFDQGVASIAATRNRALLLILGSILAGLVIAYLLSAVVAAQVSRPILNLAQSANRMAGGELNTRVPIISRDEVGAASEAFNTMAARLQGILNTLEDRVARRTAQLETAADVAASASEVREVQDLLTSTTERLVERFQDIYHAQVFLVAEQDGEQWAVLRASTGEAGRKLLERRHRLQVGSQSVIGRVTASGTHVLARTADPYSVHRPNELLPRTKAELALPMKRGGRVIGTLDVQSERHYAFTEDDIKVLQTLADQLAIAVENARLFRDLGATVAETERLFRASSAIASSSNETELFDVFIDVADEMRQVDRMSILIADELDADGRPLEVVSVRTWTLKEGKVSNSHRFDVTKVMHTVWNEVLKGTFSGPDIAEYATAYPELYKTLSALGTKAFALIPLESSGGLLGFLFLQRFTAGPIPDAITRIYNVLAPQGAVALNRFALLQQLAGQVDELQELRENFLDLGAASSLDALLQALASRAAKMVDAHASTIYLYNETGQNMELVAVHNMDEHLLGSRLGAGEGAAGEMINRQEPFTIDNYALWDARSGQFPESQTFGAVAALPLSWQGRLLGALVTINHRDQRRFDSDDMRRLTLFADQAALTIENARLLTETERSLSETAMLYNSTQALMNASSEDEMQRAILDAIGNETQDLILIARTLPDIDPPQLEVEAANNIQILVRELPERRYRSTEDMFPRGTRLPGKILVPPGVPIWESKARLINDLPNSEVADEAQFAMVFGFHSMLTVPIYTHQGFYGAVIVLRRDTNPFQDEDLTRFTTISSQFAVAVDNILLLEESRNAAHQLATAAEVSRAATTQLDLSVLLPQAVELVKEQFGYYHVQVFLLDESARWAELTASTGEIGQVLLGRKHRLLVGSRSVIGQVTATGHHILARAKEIDPTSIHSRNELLPETLTELALPMKIGDRVIGALDVQTVEPFSFKDTGDIEILQSLADQLSVAVQNARLFERTQQSLMYSQSLYRVGQELSVAETLDDVLNAIHNNIAPADTRDLSIMAVMLDEEGNPTGMRVEAVLVPQRPELKITGRSFPIVREQNKFYDTLREAREAFVIHDVDNDPRVDDLSRAIYEAMKIKALLAVPLVRMEGRHLFLQLAFGSPRHITADEIERLGTVGSQTATAIQNLYLVNSLEERAQRLAKTNVLTSKLLAATTVEEMVQLAAVEINDIMGSDQVGIVFFDQENDLSTVVAQYSSRVNASEVGTTFPISGNSAIDWLSKHREPLVSNDIRTEPALESVRAFLEMQGIRSNLMIPLFVRREMVGSIGVDTISSQRQWNAVDVSLAQTVANLLASAMEGLRLFERTQRNLEQTQALYQASQAITEAASLEEIAQAIAIHVVDDTEASVSLISLLLGSNDEVVGGRVEDAYLGSTERGLAPGMEFMGERLEVLRALKASRDPIVVRDISQESSVPLQVREDLAEIGIGSMISVPIRMADGWTGLILVTYPTARKLTNNDSSRLAAIATQAATTMQNRELLTQTQESLVESQQLYQAGSRINEAETLDALLEALIPLTDTFDPDQTTIILFEQPLLEHQNPDRITPVASIGRYSSMIPVGQSLSVTEMPLLRNLSFTSPVLVQDITGEERFSAEDKAMLLGSGVRSAIYLPLRIGLRYLGWVAFTSSEPRQISDRAVRRLQNIVQQAATALQSQQLFQEAQQRAWREEQISRITARLHSTTEPEEIMRIGLQELKRTLNIKRVMAWTQADSREPEKATNGNDASGNGTNGKHH